MPTASTTRFVREAERILALPISERVNALGGYGPDGEVVYDGHPAGCPSVLMTALDGASATFMSNGSIAFAVKLGLELSLHDARRPALRVVPHLPAALGGELTLRRVLHVAQDGGFRRHPPRQGRAGPHQRHGRGAGGGRVPRWHRPPGHRHRNHRVNAVRCAGRT